MRLLVVCLVLALSACAPGTPDEDDWRTDARRAVSSVSSQVETARLALNEGLRGHVFSRSLQSIAVDAETNASTSAGSFSAKQPPAGEIARSSRVTDELDRDVGLLTDARIAVVRGHVQEYAGLARQLAQAGQRLSTLETQLLHDPGASAS